MSFPSLIRMPINLLTFSQIMEICLEKCSSLSIMMLSNFSSSVVLIVWLLMSTDVRDGICLCFRPSDFPGTKKTFDPLHS